MRQLKRGDQIITNTTTAGPRRETITAITGNTRGTWICTETDYQRQQHEAYGAPLAGYTAYPLATFNRHLASGAIRYANPDETP